MATSPKTRDAQRSREAILAAAERLFAGRGYEGVSLAEIGAEAGVSRGTPSYFFGSKEELYRAVLARMTRDREAALTPVFAPLVAWAQDDAPAAPLRDVLRGCVDGYLGFLHGRPTYVQIIEREALAGGERLAALETESTVMEDALAALRGRAEAHGLASFDVAEVILTFVALAFMPVAHRDTLLRRQGLKLDDARRRDHLVDVLLGMLGSASSP
jgi:AcrR family transcriptional regulator